MRLKPGMKPKMASLLSPSKAVHPSCEPRTERRQDDALVTARRYMPSLGGSWLILEKVLDKMATRMVTVRPQPSDLHH